MFSDQVHSFKRRVLRVQTDDGDGNQNEAFRGEKEGEGGQVRVRKPSA